MTPEEAKNKAATTYNAASDYYDHPANTFWSRYGRRTVERLGLAPGARVLDVCCGSGASAIPAAEIVGSGGSVVGVDLAENLLELARAKAKTRALENIDFRTGDLTNLQTTPSTPWYVCSASFSYPTWSLPCANSNASRARAGVWQSRRGDHGSSSLRHPHSGIPCVKLDQIYTKVLTRGTASVKSINCALS
jgi:SAM-dependent methyltransferase